MIGILRWFFGWSEFKIEGDSNYFLNRFKENVWMVKKQGKFVICCCLTKDYKYLFDKSINYGCYITKCKDRGLLNFLRKYRFRYGMIVGVFLFLIFLFISNIFVWNISVNGNSLVQDREILKTCEENGLHFGSLVGNIDEKNIEFKLKERFPQISWVSLNRVAGKYNIEISELIKKPEIKKYDASYTEPCDVVASEDGEIVYVEAYAGTPIVVPGDIVKKGQILVSSIQTIKGQEGVVYSHAEAKIIAKVNFSKDFHFKKNSFINQKIGNKKYEKNLHFFGLKIPIELITNKEKTIKSKEIYEQLNFFGIRLPLLMQTTEYDLFEKVNLKQDLRKIKRILINEEKNWELQNFIGDTILNRSCNFVEVDDEIILNGNLLIEKRIDKKVPAKKIEDYLKKYEN